MTIEKSDLNDFSKLKVLIIDDNLLVHDLVKSTLNNLGVNTVRCAENAYFGLRLADEMEFHIIICSFNVKSDKDGFHLLEELKFKGHIKKTTTLIFLSSETDESLVNSIVELQPDDFWVKPLLAKKVEQRIIHTLDIKKRLFNIYNAIDKKEFSKVIYYADRFLLDHSLDKYHANILRMKGEAYLSLLEFEEAETFFKNLLTSYNYAWVHIGYVKALLKQGRIDEINALLKTLTDRPDTRFLTHDLLAQYYIEAEQFDVAYEEIKQATALAPRNIERNKKSLELARLNHDHKGQYQATVNIATYAKNSIHDSPALTLNVIRAGIDLATAITDESSNRILKKTEQYIAQLESNFDDANKFKQQLIVVKARLYNAKNERKRAEKLVDNHLSLRPSPQIEDNLDMVKVLHELGKREESVTLLEAIQNQLDGDSLSTDVINRYVEQEVSERSDIHFTPKQLNIMAVEYFNKNKLEPALEAVNNALTLAPHNTKLMFSQLKILITMKDKDELSTEHGILAEQSIEQLQSLPLDEAKQKALDKLITKWNKPVE